MLDSQTIVHPKDKPDPRRYLPHHLWIRWQAGDTAPGLEHLRAVLRAVLTYLPREVIQTRLADPQAPAVSGTFAQATLMFTDISGFTAMSERLTQLGREGAEVITSIVNDYFATMSEIIARHGGDLFKFGGDALLVCFSGAEAAARGGLAALEMQQAMARFAVIETDQDTFNLRMKAGLGTGTLFLASLGSSERLEFAVMGPTLGQMARAENLAEAGEVLIDQATYDAAEAGVVADERSPGFYHLTAMAEDKSDLRFLEEIASLREEVKARWLVERLDALTPYLLPGLLERIITSPGQRMIEGEHRLVTVLFANFYGINDIIKALGPGRADELTTILNRHFTTMQRIIHKYGGIVNKVDTYAVGYRIMAVFGAPIAHEDDPARAVRAALEMQEAMGAFARPGGVSTSAGRFALQQRIGVNTGYVFAGNLGSSLRQEYSVMGDEVNLAARLMGIAADGEVLISHSTARHVEGLFEWQEREPVSVKGKRQPVRNYRVSRGVASRDERVAAQGAFFGRQADLEMTQALVEAALAGHGAVLDLSGERGIGKSRLVEEVEAYASERGMTTLRGEALSYGRSIPYLPWIGVLHALFEFQEDESPERRRDRLLTGLDEFGLSDWAPVVGDVLGVEIAATPLTASLDAQLRQQRFFDVVLQLIQGRASRAPLLLMLDDMQWADAISLDLAAYVARNAPTSPLLFVIIHWPDMDVVPWLDQDDIPSEWDTDLGAAGCHILRLTEMDEGASLDLARSVLGEGDLSAPLRQLIPARAQGNPLFVEEVTRTLYESGTIRLEKEEERGEGVWVIADDAAEAKVPTTLTGLIMSRLDRLETTNRRLLQVAAVIGVDFRAPVLARVYPYGDLNGTLGNRLNELLQMDLAQFSPPDRYTFKQTLTQEVAYESLSFARRRKLHVRVGEDTEKYHAGDLAEHYGALARHFDEGRVFGKAFTYLIKAGDKARDEFANEAALGYYRRALEVAAEVKVEVEAQVLDVVEAMGDVYLLVGRYAGAIAQFQQATAHPMCSSRRHGDLLRKVGRAYELQGQYDEALGYLARGRWVLSGSEQDRHSVEMARIYNLSGWVHMRRGEPEPAVEECERGLEILTAYQGERDAAILRDEADLYNTLGTTHAELQGNYSKAAEACQRSTDLRQQAGDLPGLARSYNNLARIAWAQGDLVGAGDYLQRMLEISRQIGNNYFLAFCYNNLGAVSYTTGNVEQALDYYHTALSLRQRIGDSYGVAATYSNIGEAHLSLERYDEARRCLEQSAATFEAIQSEGELPEVYGLLAEVELAREDVASALDYAGRARRIAATIGSVEKQGIAERVLAQGQAKAGDIAQARQSFETSIELLQASGHQTELARSHYEFGSFLAGQTGQKEQAREHLQQAIDLFTATGAEKEAAQARAALASHTIRNT